jgi:hypothetical protein
MEVFVNFCNVSYACLRANSFLKNADEPNLLIFSLPRSPAILLLGHKLQHEPAILQRGDIARRYLFQDI